METDEKEDASFAMQVAMSKAFAFRRHQTLDVSEIGGGVYGCRGSRIILLCAAPLNTYRRCLTTYLGSSATQAMCASWQASTIADMPDMLI
jgi:hypothetical protein